MSAPHLARILALRLYQGALLITYTILGGFK